MGHRFGTVLIAVTLTAWQGLAGRAAAQSAGSGFVNFEGGHVRPIALSPDGSMLFAVNTPDNRLAIYSVGAGGLTLAGEVPVGLEPVAVAARSNTEVWVVNHLSDSVSIVAIDAANPGLSRMTRTLRTCDEPRDIVFAGPSSVRAFITTARRGQNCPVAANLTTSGQGPRTSPTRTRRSAGARQRLPVRPGAGVPRWGAADRAARRRRDR
jgi:DNA-binding beta-propeller fold protein YncE